MSARTKRILLAALSVLALLLLFQVLTYVFLAEGAMSGTSLRVVEYLPQYTHFAEGTTFDFACVSDRTLGALRPSDREALDVALSAHFGTIYHGEGEIPPGKWMRDPSDGTTRLGIEDGCIVEWYVYRKGLFRFTAVFSDWESVEGASSRPVTFVWLFGTWVKVWTGLTDVA